MRRGTRYALFGAVIAACAMSPASTGVAHAQTSSVTISYTPITTTPTASDFNALYFLIGYAQVTVNACAKANCDVQMTNSVNTPPGMRYAVVNSPFVTPTSCTGTLAPASGVPSAVLFTATTTPRVTRIYYCMQLTWTGSTPTTFTTPQFSFTLTQRS